jgi:hypothetical protein
LHDVMNRFHVDLRGYNFLVEPKNSAFHEPKTKQWHLISAIPPAAMAHIERVDMVHCVHTSAGEGASCMDVAMQASKVAADAASAAAGGGCPALPTTPIDDFSCERPSWAPTPE